MSVWLVHQNLIPNPASPEYKNQKVQKRIKNSSQAHSGWELLSSPTTSILLIPRDVKVFFGLSSGAPRGTRDKEGVDTEGPPRFFSVESPHHWTCKLISPLSFVKMSPFFFFFNVWQKMVLPELGCNSDD